MMRIGFDARYINDRYHGIGRYAFRLLEALAKQSKEHTFIVFLGEGQNSRFEWNELRGRSNVDFAKGVWPLFWPHEHLLWPGIIRRARIDLFHSPYFTAPLFTTIPKLITIHDLIFERLPNAMPSPWLRFYYNLLMPSGIRQASQIVTPSHATAEDLTDYYRVPRQKISVIHEAVDPHYHPEVDTEHASQLRQKYALERPYIFTIGARRPHKNFDTLVKAFAKIADLVPHDLVFAGPADERFPDKALSSARDLKVDGRVRFLDWVPEQDLPGLYRQAELFVLPSLIEGFGLPVLEAMACGIPVMAANRSSLPEVVGDTGLLFDPMSVEQLSAGMLEVLCNPWLRSKMRRQGLDRASDFSWKKAAQEILRLYTKVGAQL